MKTLAIASCCSILILAAVRQALAGPGAPEGTVDSTGRENTFVSRTGGYQLGFDPASYGYRLAPDLAPQLAQPNSETTGVDFWFKDGPKHATFFVAWDRRRTGTLSQILERRTEALARSDLSALEHIQLVGPESLTVNGRAALLLVRSGTSRSLHGMPEVVNDYNVVVQTSLRTYFIGMHNMFEGNAALDWQGTKMVTAEEISFYFRVLDEISLVGK